MKYVNYYKPALQLLLAIYFFAACNSKPDAKPLSFDRNIFHQWDSVGRKEGLEKALGYLDSCYQKISSPGLTDQVFYYKEKLRIITTDPPYTSDSTAPLPLPYIDTLAALIKKGKPVHEAQKVYAEALVNTGQYFFQKRQYEKAKRVMAEARVYGMILKDTCFLYDVVRLFADVFFHQIDYRNAIALTKEALGYVEGCEDMYAFRKQRVLDDLGFFYRNYGKPDSAVYYHQQAVQVVIAYHAQKPDSLFLYNSLANIYVNLGMAYRETGNLDASAESFNKGAKASMMVSDTVMLTDNLFELAKVYFKKGRNDSVALLVKKIEPYVERLPIMRRASYYRLRADMGERNGNLQEQVYFLKKRIAVMDSVFRDRNSARANDPQLEYEKQDKQYQTQLLQRDNRIQQNKTTAAVLIGSVLLIGIVLSVWLLSRLRKLVKRKEVLNHQLQVSLTERERIEKELREKELSAQEMELNMEFQAAILEQRRQISDDMHDELSSSLAALKFFVTDLRERAGSGEPEKTLREIEAEVSSVYTNARGYMHSLKTNDWRTRFSLTGLLKDVQQKFRQKNLMDVVLKIDEEGIKHRLSTSQHDQLYHITKECVSNVIKHANATRLEIRVLFGHGTCHFEIQDNGHGFDKNKVMRGIGLESIAKRVTGMGGTVDIQSSDTGTTISGNFPVD